MSIPMTSRQVLDRYFLEMRGKVLEVAAALDRVDRGQGSVAAAEDARIKQLDEAIGALLHDGPGRAEEVQRIFSLPYDAEWPRPKLGE